MSGRWPFVAETIAARIALIEPLVHRRRSVLPNFRLLPLDTAMIDAPIDADPAAWDEVAPQSYWGKADLNFILKTTLTVPRDWNAAHIALHLPLGVLGDIFNHPEALVHIDGAPIGSADRHHHTLRLPPGLADGRPHALVLHGWTGLAGWPPDPDCKAKLFMGTPAVVERDETLLEFHRLAATVLDTAQLLDPDAPECAALLAALEAAFLILDTRAPLGDALYATAAEALASLQGDIARAGSPRDVTLHGIGHAHMDIAYLWPISQIRLKNARTTSNVLRLMDMDPDYLFSHSQPQLYEMTREDYPHLFEQIKTRVSEGRWEVMGGMWVEPDLNVPGPEALIRQLTLGRQYFKDTFGDVETPVLWLPDTFGFPAQIPQLMQLAGLKWFVTNKLNWNQYNAVPSSTHHWDGLDGSRVLAHVLTTPRDVQYLPFPTNYKSDLSAAEVSGTATRSTAPDTVRDQLICYGYGDGGGGPTEDLLAKAHAYSAMPGMPRFRHSTVRAFFETIERTSPELPVWQGEHYMEGHRGVYTSQGWLKRANRKAEWALHEAEALAAMAGHPTDLDDAWRLLCLNQFHDILSGTAISEVFETSRQDFARIMESAEAQSDSTADALGETTWSVANTAPTSGSRLVSVPIEAVDSGQITDTGRLLYFEDCPSYSVVQIASASMPNGGVTCVENEGSFTLENDTLRVVVNDAGQLTSVHMKSTNTKVLKTGEAGNTLLAFEDRPICWDAWDIDPGYEARMETVAGQTTCEITEAGPLRACLTVTTRWRSSTIRQHIRLRAHSDRVDFETNVDWHETQTLLKAAFPTCIQTTEATFDVQWGQTKRPAHRDTPFAAARFEVPAQKWAKVEEGALAVALLNDCKYGYDVLGGTLRITLIKSSTAPDPKADQGHHAFTYSLLPFAAKQPEILDHEAYDLNAPIRVIAPSSVPSVLPAPLVKSLTPGVIVETIKPADDGNGLIVRLFEAHGISSQTTLQCVQPVQAAHYVTIFEEALTRIEARDATIILSLAPFEIVSLRVVLE